MLCSLSCTYKTSQIKTVDIVVGDLLKIPKQEICRIILAEEQSTCSFIIKIMGFIK